MSVHSMGIHDVTMHDVGVHGVGVYSVDMLAMGIYKMLNFFSGKKLIFDAHLRKKVFL